MGATKISVQTDDPTNTGVYKFKITAKDPRTGALNNSVTFELTIVCRIADLKPQYDSTT